MTREEFERFRIVMQGCCPKDRELSCRQNNPNYTSMIPRYVDTTTTAITRYNILPTSAAGIYIDIFILDPVPEDRELRKKHRNLLYIYSEFIMPHYAYCGRLDDEYLNQYKKYKRLERRIGRQKVLETLEKELFSGTENDNSFYMVRWGSVPFTFAKKTMGNPRLVDFCDIKIPVAEDWNMFLIQQFGLDWMNIPDRISNEGHNAYINTEVDYKKTYDRYISDIKKDLLIDASNKYKEYSWKISKNNRKYEYKFLEEIDDYVKEDLRHNSNNDEPILKKYKKYINLQTSNTFIGKTTHGRIYRYYNPYIITINDDEIYNVLVALFDNSKFKQFERITRALVLSGRDRSKEINDIIDDYISMVSALTLYFENNLGECERIIDYLLEDKSHSNIIIDYLHTSLIIKNTDLKDEDKLAVIKKIKEKYPQSFEIKKLEADYYYIEDQEKAAEIYKSLLPNLKNAMLLKDIEQKIHQEKAWQDEGADETFVTEYGQVHLNLLKEIKTLCEKNSIEFYLCGNTEKNAILWGSFGDERKSPTIEMSKNDLTGFKELVNQQISSKVLENRTIEEYLSSDGKSEKQLKYGIKNSAVIDLKKKTKECFGIVVKENNNEGLQKNKTFLYGEQFLSKKPANSIERKSSMKYSRRKIYEFPYYYIIDLDKSYNDIRIDWKTGCKDTMKQALVRYYSKKRRSCEQAFNREWEKVLAL